TSYSARAPTTWPTTRRSAWPCTPRVPTQGPAARASTSSTAGWSSRATSRRGNLPVSSRAQRGTPSEQARLLAVAVAHGAGATHRGGARRGGAGAAVAVRRHAGGNRRWHAHRGLLCRAGAAHLLGLVLDARAARRALRRAPLSRRPAGAVPGRPAH